MVMAMTMVESESGGDSRVDIGGRSTNRITILDVVTITIVRLKMTQTESFDRIALRHPW
jgi:hypothetical protein